MKIWRYGIAVGLLAGLGACSNLMGGGNNSSSQAAPLAATQPTVAPAMVKQVQAKLRDSGYYKQGNVDGMWGSETENAVRSFQRDHNLNASGQLDVATLQALNIPNGSGASNNNGTNNNGTNNNGTNNNAGANSNAAMGNTAPTQPMNGNPNSPPANNTAPASSR